MDDRITNLRLCTRSANCLNKEVQTNNKLGLRNIHKNYVGEYVVQIQANGARLRKSFTDLLSAVQYRDAVVLSLHGDYAGAYSRVASPPAEVHAPPCVARASADSDSGVDSPV